MEEYHTETNSKNKIKNKKAIYLPNLMEEYHTGTNSKK